MTSQNSQSFLELQKQLQALLSENVLESFSYDELDELSGLISSFHSRIYAQMREKCDDAEFAEILRIFSNRKPRK